MQKKPGLFLPVQASACFVLFSILATSGSIVAQDSCAEAAGIGIETITGSTSGAPRGGESDCGRSDDSPSHWFRFTAEADTRMMVSTCGSDFDTVLSVYSGCPGAEDNEITCNDDACSAGSRQSDVEFDATAGEEYLIRLAGYRGETGDYTLEVASEGDGPGPDPEPVNCEDVQEVDITDTVEGDTSGLKNTGSASCGSSARSPDAIFRHVATQACLLTLSTCGSSYDTVLSIHSGCPPTEENELACNDDSCALQSTVGYEVEPGESYWIRVSGYNGASGNFTLGLSCAEPPPMGDGADITISSMSNIRQMGRLSEVVAISMRSTICNMGSESVDWYGNPDPRHPFLVFNLYRMQEGRL